MRISLQIKSIAVAGALMLLGSILFKLIHMIRWGKDILFDASFHIMSAFFILYVLWFFVDQNKSWHNEYFLLCALILFIIAMQRVIANAHNDIGLLLGLVISLVSIGIAERKAIRGKFRF